ncbi:MAG TPA: hypothetical protein VHE35_13830 [Kofleriaceae bacterium]|nr:hypothetical protein [Kofleriaceae bacterium]
MPPISLAIAARCAPLLSTPAARLAANGGRRSRDFRGAADFVSDIG